MGAFSMRIVRLFQITLLLLSWFTFGLAGFSFSIDKPEEGIIELLGLMTLMIVLIDGRILRRLSERATSGKFLVGVYAIIVVNVYGAVQDFRIMDPILLGELYIPGIIVYVRAVGTILLAAILLWETIAVTRQFLSPGQ